MATLEKTATLEAPREIANTNVSETMVETVESESSKRASQNSSEYDSEQDGHSENDEDLEEGEVCSGSEGSVILEREEGDGQESALPAGRKVDDDEDKKNPQYIPKRGTFYEHDDRTMDDETENPEEKEKQEKEGKKQIWTDKKEKWNHDKFNDNEQAPKTRTELISIYGYDIRNEDGPPRARRRRRYGRGPNKYTRNWEDEDAYGKPVAVVNKRVGNRKPNRNDQPNQGDDDDESREENERKDQGSASGDRPPTEEQNHERRPPTDEQRRPHNPQKYRDTPPRLTSNIQVERQNSKNARFGTGRTNKPNPREIKDSDYRGFTTPRQYAKRSDPPPNVGSNASRNATRPSDLEQDMAGLSLQEQQGPKGTKYHANNSSNSGGGGGGGGGGNRQSSVPPRMQSEQKGSKRYSSIRQRSLPDAAPLPNFVQQQQPPPPPQQHYFAPNDFPQQNQLANAPAPLLHQSAQQILPPPPLPALPGQQVPVTAQQLPPQFAGPFGQPAPPAFLQAAPPPFIPQQTPPPLLNYVAGQAPFPPGPQPTFANYPPTFNPVNQPSEVFQPPGGITYYSPEEQQAALRAAPQRRPKAAIPIVPPPPEHRGRGRSANSDAPSPNRSASASGDIGMTSDAGSLTENFEDAVSVQ